jgi:hypothetical protein
MTTFRPGFYRHYKGGTYAAVALVEHHETREKMVVYFSAEHGSWNVRPLVGTPTDPDGWSDPSPTDPNRPRFEYTGPTE